MAVHTVNASTRRLAAVGLAVAVLVALGSTAGAGGWAIGSIDAIPDARAGQTVDVGFTILQHGVTPVELEDDVGIEIRLADGSVDYFAATSAGTTGRYVAAVTLPASGGEYEWSIHMGWFGVQELGTLEVLPTEHDSTWSSWSTGRWAMLAVTIVLAAAAVADLVLTRGRSRALPV